MKNQIYIALILFFGIFHLTTSAQLSCEVRMTNFEQVSEIEFQFDLQLRNDAADPVTNEWAYNDSQVQIDLNPTAFNGGQLINLYLTVDNVETGLVSSQQLGNSDFFYSGPNTALATNSPSMNTDDEVTLFNDNTWRTISRFSVKLRDQFNGDWHNWSDINPGFAFRVSDTKIFGCAYYDDNGTARRGLSPGLDGGSFEITNKTLTLDVPYRQLAGYCFTGTGNWNDAVNWNNELPTGHAAYHAAPQPHGNAIINGNVTIPDGLTVSLTPSGGNGGEVTVLTGSPQLFSLTLVPNGTGASVTLYDNLFNIIANPAIDVVPGTQFYFNTSGIPPTGTFINWTDQNSNVIGTAAFFGPYTMPAENMTITANWTSGTKSQNTGKEINDLYASLTIATGGKMTVDKLFNDNVNGVAAIVLQSVTGQVTGSLIHNNSGVNATIERTLVQNQWHFVSSSISNGKSAIFNNIYLKEMNEPLGGYFYIVPLDVDLEPMKGYEAWSSTTFGSPDEVFYKGNINTGSITMNNLTHTPDAPTDTVPYPGYNLVGNPYASAINWDASGGWSKNDVENAIYIWNPVASNFSSYVNGSGTNGGTKYIPSGQGFFVHVPAGTGGTANNTSLTVNPSARVHNAQLFLKNGESITSNPLLRLSTYSEVNDYLDETVITFDEESTINFDGQFDAYKMTGLEEAPQLYSTTVDMIELSINSMPAVDENMIVPLNYKVGISGIYTIEATEMLNFTGATDIILEDKKEGTFINLTEQNTYSFAADPSDDVERFNVYFYFNPSTEIETMALSNLHIFTSQHKLILESLTNDVLSGQLHVYTLLGQQVAGEKVNAGLKYETEIQEEGIYIVTFYNQQDQKQYRQKIQIR